ncbi:hypothetical protein GT038_12190, partial [Streptomyces sp. SID337]|nr:hypothetical protein [Streptomyces sp. SID337]
MVQHESQLARPAGPGIRPDGPHHLPARRIEPSSSHTSQLAHIHSVARRIRALDQPLHTDRTRLLDDQP